MVESNKRNLLLTLFYDEFLLLEIVRNNDLNSTINGKTNLCISDCWSKLEKVLDRPLGRQFLSDKCHRLISHGFLIHEDGSGGRKNLCLSPSVVKIFDCFDEMGRGLK